MIGKILEVFTEYIGIILCIHKVAGKKIRTSRCILLDLICYMVLAFLVENIRFGKLVMFVYWFAYIRIRVNKDWKQTIKSFVITVCIIPMIQLLIYAAIGEGMLKIFDIYSVIIFINTLIIIFFAVWKEKYLLVLMEMVTKFGRVIFFVLLFFLFKCLISYFSEYKVINAYSMRQIVICFLIVALMFIFWINSENEKKHKAEELRAYQLYTKTFEDAVATIRMKQHEFDNHINAIRSMRLTIQDIEELFNEQDKYCDRILQDNRYNKVLKLNMSPILIGYLYSKFTAASAYGINIAYEIQDINIEYIAINDLIEIIGILYDNAIEALKEQGDTEMEVKIVELENTFVISVANISSWKTNSEIEKFFQYGYSTKGQEHGIGLYRVNVLLKKYKASMQAENVTKNGMNYICFKITF